MAIEYFCCYHSYLRKIAKLSDQEVGRLFRSLLTYSETGEAQELAGREAVAFDFIADDIDRAKEAYAKKCAALKANGEKAAAGKSQQLPPNGTNCHQMPADAPQDKDKDKDKNKITLSAPKPPSGGARGDAFDRFWACYPRKVGKGAAKKAFDRVKVPVESLLVALETQKRSEQWTRDGGRFVPNPSTWLNQERWEDEGTVVSYANTCRPSLTSERYENVDYRKIDARNIGPSKENNE